MPYDGTNNLNQLDATKPLDNELADILGAALRETRLVIKTVIENEHNSDGTHKSGFVIADYIADGAITVDKIPDGTITAGKLATGVLSGLTPGNTTVGTAQLIDGSVTTAKLATAAVGNGQIATGAVTAIKMSGAGLAQFLVGQADGSFALKSITGAIAIDSTGNSTVTSTVSLDVISIRDLKAANTGGGGFTSATDTTRDLNSLIDPQNISSLSGNQFTLPAGTYFVYSTAPAYNVGNHQCRLYNVTDSADALIGSSSACPAATETHSIIAGIVTITDPKTFAIKHKCGTTNATDGLGHAVNLASSEVYTQVFIVKVA